MGDIRVIVKRPNELYGHTVNISNDLKTFQGIVIDMTTWKRMLVQWGN